MKKVVFFLFIATSFSVFQSCNKKSDDTANAKDSVAAREASAEALSYNVDTESSVINWTGSKQTGKHEGVIKISDGIVFVKNGAVEGGNFTIDMNTISVNDLSGDEKAQLEGHLKGVTAHEKDDHFFNVKKYPTAKFQITGIHSESGKSIVEGNLTMKQTTKNIQFPAIVSVDGNKVSIVSDTFTIDRTQWKVNYGSKTVFQDLGDKFVNDEIELKVSVKASK
jgi:polyisoprenoid-binding protein YceI